MPTICPGCQLSVDPIRIFEKSPKANKWWRITRCPRERCAFNIDLDACDYPPGGEDKKDGRRSFWKGDHWE